MKKETLEEFINEELEDVFFTNISKRKEAERLIEIGAKWQQERSYSNEDMKRAFRVGFSIGYGSPVNGLDSKDETCEIWFDKLTKK
jgi:hypothetical protein